MPASKNLVYKRKNTLEILGILSHTFYPIKIIYKSPK